MEIIIRNSLWFHTDLSRRASKQSGMFFLLNSWSSLFKSRKLHISSIVNLHWQLRKGNLISWRGYNFATQLIIDQLYIKWYYLWKEVYSFLSHRWNGWFQMNCWITLFVPTIIIIQLFIWNHSFHRWVLFSSLILL